MVDDAREPLRSTLLVPALLGLSALLCPAVTAPASAQEVVLAFAGHGAYGPRAPLDAPRVVVEGVPDGHETPLVPLEEVPVAVAPPSPEPGSSFGVLERVVVTLAEPRSSDDEPDLGSLGDVLPAPLCRDLLRLRSRVQSARQVLFGQRGILRLGDVGPDDERSRLRLNLQYSPDPGIRFTIVTG